MSTLTVVPAISFNAFERLNDDTGLGQLVAFVQSSNWLVHSYQGDDGHQTKLQDLWDTAKAEVVLGEAQFGAQVSTEPYFVFWESRTITLKKGLRMGEALIYLVQELVNACNGESFKSLRKSAERMQTGVYVIETERFEYRAFRPRVDVATYLDVVTEKTWPENVTWKTWQFFNTQPGSTQPATSWNEYMYQLNPLHMAAIREQHRKLIGLERDKFEGLLCEYKPGEIKIKVQTSGRKDSGQIRVFRDAQYHLEMDPGLRASNLPASVVVQVSKDNVTELYGDPNNPKQIEKRTGQIVTVTPKV